MSTMRWRTTKNPGHQSRETTLDESETRANRSNTKEPWGASFSGASSETCRPSSPSTGWGGFNDRADMNGTWEEGIDFNDDEESTPEQRLHPLPRSATPKKPPHQMSGRYLNHKKYQPSLRYPVRHPVRHLLRQCALPLEIRGCLLQFPIEERSNRQDLGGKNTIKPKRHWMLRGLSQNVGFRSQYNQYLRA